MKTLRAQFPVLDRIAYLNAGTNGPVPRRAVDAALASLRAQAEGGRGSAAFIDALLADQDGLRGRVADLLGCEPSTVALTRSTTDGVNAALAALDLRRGDEVLTSDEEHPGVLAPLAGLRRRPGIRVRTAPFAELPGEVGPDTRLVACSHVSWVTGRVMDAEALGAAGAPVVLDGAQGLGAVPVDVRALGCDFYAASGQKWLCGPNGIGYLYARAELVGDLPVPWPGYQSIVDPGSALDSPPHPDARRLATGFPSPHDTAFAHAALDVLEEDGMEPAYRRAAGLAGRLADALAERGVRVAPRGASTLVSFEAPDPVAFVERLRADERIVVRFLPGTPYVRASVGAWSSEEELDRLVKLAAA
ncbi:MAG TPA: aminotransferase class V-fold PLP-dependent enzyme [Thermoleophilaceae bacterium]|nr:aminotransferase class V-fold PLP-dependent enzyme [Thermoleophilaceae bacterium]